MIDDLKLRVWWIPQVPMSEQFTVDVSTVEEGRALMDVLARYDAFQFENHIKPDYCNAGGLSYQHPSHTGGEWHDVPDDDDEWAEYLQEMLTSRA